MCSRLQPIPHRTVISRLRRYRRHRKPNIMPHDPLFVHIVSNRRIRRKPLRLNIQNMKRNLRIPSSPVERLVPRRKTGQGIVIVVHILIETKVVACLRACGPAEMVLPQSDGFLQVTP